MTGIDEKGLVILPNDVVYLSSPMAGSPDLFTPLRGAASSFNRHQTAQAVMSFISLWAGNIDPPGSLPLHLDMLYNSLGDSNFQRDPRVCAERELVPIED